MRALAFLTLRKIKNRIKELVHHPGQLLLVLLGVALIAFVFVTGNSATESPQFGTRSFREFEALVFVLYAAVFVMTAKNGFVNGASMFTMADVNLLFCGPMKSRLLMFYGLCSQLGRSLLMGVVLLYQYSWLHQAYGISPTDLVLVLVGYGMTVFLSQMVAMLIYSFTASDDRRCRIAKAVFYGVILIFVALAAFQITSGEGELLKKAVALMDAPWIHFFPVAGFLQLGVVSCLNANWLLALLMLLAFFLCIGIYVVAVSFLNDDFYEDVLKATEVSFSAITARKEGKVQETAPRNVKVGKTGIGRGSGASAFYYKHLLENRRSRFFVLDLGSLIIAAITVVYALFLKQLESAFVMSAYLMMINVGTGRWARELLLPYAYLVPEKPFKKLMYLMLEQFPALIVQSLVTFIPFHFIFHLTVLETAALCVARICFGWLFIGVNLIMQRLFGTGGNRSLIVVVYFLLSMLAAIPAAATAISLQAVAGVSMAVSFFAMSGVNLLLGTAFVFGCRNLLVDAQLNNR